MAGDLRRPGDRPLTPDATTDQPPDEPPTLRDSYVDDPDDIFDRNPDRDRGQDRDTADLGQTDHEDAARESDADADVPFDFDPRRAGLADTTAEDAAAYIAANKDAVPWLAPAQDRHPQVQRVYAAQDQGLGHALPRHDGYGDDETYQRRVAYLEDPAQLDDAKRTAGIDGTKPGDKKHFCGAQATRIHDADAFAMAFARGIEHPKVRAVLDRAHDPNYDPPRVIVPITELLGAHGHRYCSGFQLVGEDAKQAQKDRKAWLQSEHRDELTEPTTEPIPTFESGGIEFRFMPNKAGTGYEVVTMFPQPTTPSSKG